MKKIISILLIGLISIMFNPFSVNAKSVPTLDVENNNNKFTVSGTIEPGVLAVAVLVYSGEDLMHMETCSTDNNNNYSCELSKTFGIGDYIVKVADYDGGDYISKNISVTVNEDNPQTGDNIIISIIIGGLSILGITGCIIYFKKRKI